MTIPAGLVTHDDAEFQAWKAKQAGGGAPPAASTTHDDAEFQAWKAKQVPPVAANSTTALPRNRPNPTGDGESMLQTVLAEGANLGLGIPGVKALGAGVRSLVRGQSYGDAVKDIDAAVGKLPASHQFLGKMVGAAPLALIPGSPAMVGAGVAAADQLLDASPDAGIGDRVKNAAIAAPIGFGVGKLSDALATRVRSALTPSLGKAALDRKAATAAADRVAYGAAETEGAAAPAIPPVVTKTLGDPAIAPYARAVRSTAEFKNADDATVAREAYKLMSERQGMLDGKLSNSDFKAGTSLENRDIGAAKDRLLRAVSEPSIEIPEPPKPPAPTPPPARATPKKLVLTDPVRDPETNLLRRDLSTVPEHALDAEWQRLAQLNAEEEALHAGAQEAGYRFDYNELSGSEKTGIKGKSGVDKSGIGDGLADPDRIAADNKVIADFRKSAIVRQARQRAMDRLQAELETRGVSTGGGDPTDFEFGANASAPPKPAPKPAAPAPPPVQLGPVAPIHHPPLMPSFPAAVEQHANAMGERDAFRQGSDVARRAFTDQSVAGRNLDKKSQEAFIAAAQQMSDAKKAAAVQGILGRVKEQPVFARFAKLPLPFPSKATRDATNLVRSVGAPDQAVWDLLAKLGISSANSATTP